MRKHIIRLITITFLLAACSPSSPRREGVPENQAPVTYSTETETAEINSKVDILFVIDDSFSMLDEQRNLSKSIDSFVNEISKNTIIDFHIGVLTSYDSQNVSKFDVYKQMAPLGHLHPLKDPKDEKIRNNSVPPYVTKQTPELVQTLKNTLKVGIIGNKQTPYVEEFFRPVLAALTPELNNGHNRGFYRQDAHLVVIFITDADDTSLGISPSDFVAQIEALKESREKVQLYGVTMPSNYTKYGSNQCRPDADKNDQDQIGQLFPKRLRSALKSSGHEPYNICSTDFGPDMAKLGVELVKKVGTQTIPLKNKPDENKKFEVYYGSQLIPRQTKDVEGWSYEPCQNNIIISSKVKLKDEPNARISVVMTPVKLENLKNGYTKRVGNCE